MTLHRRQGIQTARPPAARIRLPADMSGSEWPHGNRMTAALLLAEDRMLAMTPPCTGASCIPAVTAAVTQRAGLAIPGIARYPRWPFALSFRATSLW